MKNLTVKNNTDTKRCRHCGQTYRRNINYSQPKWVESTFCSNSCSAQGRVRHKKVGVKQCIQCDSNYKRHGRHSDKQWIDKKYCSNTCAGLGRRTWAGGYKYYRHLAMSQPAYKVWRQSVFERDGFTCQHCFQRGGDLEADHIKPWATHPELRYDTHNGRTLCKPCHRKTPTYGRPRSVLCAQS